VVLPNPAFIDANARHDANVLRALGELVSEGQEGVRGATHLAVKALTTPGGAITVAPGVYSVKNTAAGGSYENYVGKVLENEQVSVTPTDSSGARTDLVVLRIENPYVAGAGTWAEPASPADGPYAHVRVIEGVPANTQTVKAVNGTWTALTLARITRPANTGIVTQAHITDLRSMIDLTVERIVVINNPPADPPPIAQSVWTESTPVGNNAELRHTDTAWTQFPTGVSWKVPIPSWALGVDTLVLCQPALISGDFIGEMRLAFDNDQVGTVPVNVNENLDGQTRYRTTLMISGTETLPASLRGREVTLRVQGRSTSSGLGGRLVCQPGTRFYLNMTFKRYPVVSDGA
jgi:hypothetical protein